MTNLSTNLNGVYSLLSNEFALTSSKTLQEGLPSWLVFCFFLYLAGLLGMLFNFKNFIVTMMTIEMMYLGVVSSFVLYGTVCNDSRASIYGLLILILAACESAIGLGLLIVLYRFGRTIDFESYQQLGG